MVHISTKNGLLVWPLLLILLISILNVDEIYAEKKISSSKQNHKKSYDKNPVDTCKDIQNRSEKLHGKLTKLEDKLNKKKEKDPDSFKDCHLFNHKDKDDLSDIVPEIFNLRKGTPIKNYETDCGKGSRNFCFHGRNFGQLVHSLDAKGAYAYNDPLMMERSLMERSFDFDPENFDRRMLTVDDDDAATDPYCKKVPVPIVQLDGTLIGIDQCNNIIRELQSKGFTSDFTCPTSGSVSTEQDCANSNGNINTYDGFNFCVPKNSHYSNMAWYGCSGEPLH